MDWNSQLDEAFTLQGKVVVITGAASGLGQEAARIFALAGAWTVLADVDEAGLKETAAIVAEEGGKSLVRRTDVSSRDDCDALADGALAEWGALDVWINGAGISYLHPILDTDSAKAERIVSINIMGPYWGTVAAARVMKEHGGGSIVNISSGGGASRFPASRSTA